MPAKTYTVGPGSLKFGETASELDLSCQVSSVEITWDSDSEDPTNVLCGDAVAGETTYTATLSVTALQDITAGGVIDYSWKNKGTEVPFIYVPNDKVGTTIEGRCTINPIDMGGEVKTRPTSDFEWPCIGEPVMKFAGDTVGE